MPPRNSAPQTSFTANHLNNGLQIHYSYRGHDAPVIRSGQKRVFALQTVQDQAVVLDMPYADHMDLEALRQPDFPGWRRNEENVWVSPWGDRRVPRALSNGVEFSVAPVPPEREIEWTNPDGDGWFRISVKNTGDAAVDVAALPSRMGDILWQEAILLHIQGKTYILPGSGSGLEQSEPFRLEAGAEVSGTIHAIAVEGPEWPRGGSRVALNFILGNQVRSHSFYYMSRHHDNMRKSTP